MTINALKVFRAWLLRPFSAATVPLRCRLGHYAKWCAGRSVFYGPPEFLAVCQTAMKELETTDAALSQSILTRKFRVWYEPAGPAFFYKHFGISEAYFAWRDQGIIACLAYLHFEAQLAHGAKAWGSALRDYPVLEAKVYAAVRGWLHEHQFPQDLALGFN
jgi:hypothetical protein